MNKRHGQSSALLGYILVLIFLPEQGVSQTPDPLKEPPSPGSFPVRLTDATGEQVSIRALDRIVTLNGDVTEVVFSLGFGDRVIAVDFSSSYPEAVNNLPKVSNQRRLSSEGILSLNPTLVLGTENAGPPEVIEQIRQSGISLVLVPDPPTLESPVKKIRMVAQALGVPGRGQALVTTLKQKIQEAEIAAKKVDSHPRVLFLYLRGTQTQLAAGNNTQPHVLIEAAGGRDAGDESGIQGYKPLTPEALITANPDILLVPERGLQSVGGLEGLRQIPGIALTRAGRLGKIVSFEDLYLLGMGPRTGDLLGDLVKAFHSTSRHDEHANN